MKKTPEKAQRVFVSGPSLTPAGELIMHEALAAADHVEIEQKGAPAVRESPTREHGYPLPAGARRNDTLGGATSLAPGRNYTLIVYDVELELDAVAVFYERHLTAAKRTNDGQQVRFATKEGEVRLARVAQGTRITLVIGPR